MSTVNIEINKKELLDNIQEEISRVAKSAYDGEGKSLYDTIIPYTRDADTIERLINDAISRLTDRSRDILVEYVKGKMPEELYHVDMVFIADDTVKRYYFASSPPTEGMRVKDEDGQYVNWTVAVMHAIEANLYIIGFEDWTTEPITVVANGRFPADSEKELYVHPYTFKYNLPDFNPSLLDMVTADVYRFFVQHVTAQWLVEKQYARAEEFVAHANVVLEETIHHLKIRKPVNDRIQL